MTNKNIFEELQSFMHSFRTKTRRVAKRMYFYFTMEGEGKENIEPLQYRLTFAQNVGEMCCQEDKSRSIFTLHMRQNMNTQLREESHSKTINQRWYHNMQDTLTLPITFSHVTDRYPTLEWEEEGSPALKKALYPKLK